MKLTTKSEYSLLILIYLARADANKFVRLEEICGTYGLSLKYAEQLVGVLKKSGLVLSRRGVAGGYRLGRSAAEISMADVVRLMDGALAPIGAVSEYFPSHTPLEKEAGVLAVMKDIRDHVAQVMERKTLADLI